MLGPVGSVSAQHNWTNGDPANDLWTTPGNWDMPSVPGPGDLALINSPPAQGPVINTDVTARKAVRLRYAANAGSPGGAAALNVSGGTLTCLGPIEMEGAHGSMTVNLGGGVVSCASFDPNGPYTMNICGGTLTIGGDVTTDIQADIDAG